MSIQTALRIRLPNRPGELVKVSKQLAQAGVNLETGAGVASGDIGELEIMVNDIPTATRILRDQGIQFREVQVALTWLTNKPGTAAQALSALADAGINVESIYLVRTEGDRQLSALGTSDPQKADQILSKLTS